MTSPRTEIGMIWAQTASGVIGDDGGMPWHLPEDLAHFKEQTRGCPVVMGRRTWESFPPKYRPLPGRTNIVITRDQQAAVEITRLGGQTVTSLDSGLELAAGSGAEKVWIIGGGRVYAEAVERSTAELAVITVIHTQVSGDTSAPQLTDEWQLERRDPPTGTHRSANGLEYHIETHRRGDGASRQLRRGA
ncbi:dihydrofolate reductase [Nesterenkonia halotolerans]|uniref:Dihydrofolate reductase n=1 Tax=Nesterenkonia halotolerans TaxID=225325 RepID=A0ABR9J955_9MICC|nr:dihydrofolate reductase [Nesterenkonia halotolerans]MBE1515397.1 dihydrofolate reductase [Nesterenkonia halotolerans]